MMPGQCLDLADMIEIDGELDKAHWPLARW
jgi:hypothetical protein